MFLICSYLSCFSRGQPRVGAWSVRQASLAQFAGAHQLYWGRRLPGLIMNLFCASDYTQGSNAARLQPRLRGRSDRRFSNSPREACNPASARL